MDANVIRAVVVDPAVEGRLVIKEVPAPSATQSDALVRVKAISLNLGETRNALTEAPAGWRPGWDFAGVVEKAAADGSGPKAGARVVGMVFQGSWAELLAVPESFLAELPDSVSFEQAATLPVAGLTALYGLERNGSIPRAQGADHRRPSISKLRGSKSRKSQRSSIAIAPSAGKPCSRSECESDFWGWELAQQYDDTDVIRILSERNPKREGSAAWHMWTYYKEGMSVGEFRRLVRCGRHRPKDANADLKWNVEHKFIRIEPEKSLVSATKNARGTSLS